MQSAAHSQSFGGSITDFIIILISPDSSRFNPHGKALESESTGGSAAIAVPFSHFQTGNPTPSPRAVSAAEPGSPQKLARLHGDRRIPGAGAGNPSKQGSISSTVAFFPKQIKELFGS